MYMRAEGIGNTPVRIGKSFLNFGSSFGQISKALKRDKESISVLFRKSEEICFSTSTNEFGSN